MKSSASEKSTTQDAPEAWTFFLSAPSVRPSAPSSSALASAPNLYILLVKLLPRIREKLQAKFELPSSSQAATSLALINLHDTRGPAAPISTTQEREQQQD
jgi:hypothetical protein